MSNHHRGGCRRSLAQLGRLTAHSPRLRWWNRWEENIFCTFLVTLAGFAKYIVLCCVPPSPQSSTMLASVISLLSCSLAISLVSGNDDDLLVATKNGMVRGKAMQVMDGEVRFFLGIPYGKPPVGELRFKKSQPVDNWEGVKETTSYSDSCYQNADTSFPGRSPRGILETVFYCMVWSSIHHT